MFVSGSFISICQVRLRPLGLRTNKYIYKNAKHTFNFHFKNYDDDDDMIHTSEGGGKMDWNDPVVVEEDEEETIGPKRWSKDEEEEDEDEPAEFFLSMDRSLQIYVVYLFLYVKGLVLCS